MSENEAQGRMFGPIAIVSRRQIGCSKERAVASMLGFQERNVRIRSDRASRFCSDPDKRIVLRMQDERGHGDAVQDASSAGTSIIIIR